jgi:hypothetical protein
MTRAFIEGASDRANKLDQKNFHPNQVEYDKGWAAMQAILGPIEDAIICHTIMYKVEAEKFVRELEDSFRDRGVDGSSCDPLQTAFPVAGDKITTTDH